MIEDSLPHKVNRVGADLSHFWVVTVLSNPTRVRRRYELYRDFARMVKRAGVKLVTVELAFGDRDFMVTEPGNKYHVQLRTVEELWHKENMINLGVQRAAHLDPHIREVAWIDADLRPMNEPRKWFEETWHELQHFEFVQMYEWFMDLDTEGNPLNGPRPSFMGSYYHGGMQQPPQIEDPGQYNVPAKFWLGPPGGAWAANIPSFKRVGGLIDKCPLGSADWHMAQGLLGILEPREGEHWSPEYSDMLYNWQERALLGIKKDIGYVAGGLMHDNHGPKKYRYYIPRKKILVEHEFNPNTDLIYDHQGLLQLVTENERQIRLRDLIRQYFRMLCGDTPEFRERPKGWFKE